MSGKASLAKNLELLGIQLVDENLQKVLKRVVELGDTKKDKPLNFYAASKKANDIFFKFY